MNQTGSTEKQQQPSRTEVRDDDWTNHVKIDGLPDNRRRPERPQLFPPCKALRRWPANYPVDELADLDDKEMNETDPNRFVYSEAEIEAWSMIVDALLDETTGPRGCEVAGPRCGIRKG